jgi:putative spermidine/putrescine transport system substrate-binding protein
MRTTRRAVLGIAAGLPLMSLRRAMAQGAPQVIVATYAGLGTALWKRIVTEPFSKETGIATDVFESALPSASVAQSEGKPQFNLAVVAEYSVPSLIKRNLIELLTPDDLPGIRNVPEKLWPRTPDGKLMGMPLYFGLFGIAYNTELAKPSDFASWKSLLDPKWKGQISITRPNFLAAYDVQLYARLGGGDEHNLQPGYDFLRRLVPQTLNFYSSMASLEAQLARGEVVASAFYANEIAMLRRKGATEVAIRIPDEGGLILPYLLVLPKGAMNPDAAKRLMNAIIEPRYQAAFAEESLVWPMNDKTPLSDALRKEMGLSAEEAVAHNISLDWWTVGSNLQDETYRIEAMLQEIK